MHLSKNGDTYALRCHCGCYNLSFVDHGTELTGTATCIICGAAAEWAELLQGCADTGQSEPEGGFALATSLGLPGS